MATKEGPDTAGDPSPDEIAAALAAVRLLQRQREQGAVARSRWARAGRVEAVTPSPRPAVGQFGAGSVWAAAERPL